ncbi:MAG: branched-chain amino acid ABC transporter substrate-binding protein [Alphaproteobacteria bacterium]|nr:branched-chain amino acid ABC transporter substrate-binding protein [Alphaproteobacteria bacterium]
MAAALLWAGSLSILGARADVTIGLAGPLTGQYQAFGQQMLVGVKAALDGINAKGGIGGEQLVLVTADDQCDAAKAEDAAQKLITAHADVVIGSFCSVPSLAAARLYDKAGITSISPAATLPLLTEAGLATVIRLAPRADTQGAFAARRILAKRPNARLALLDDGTAQMKALIASFSAAYGKGASLTASFAPDAKDYSDLVGKMKAAGIDTAYLAASATDAGRITAQAQAAGVAIKRYGPDSLLADAFWEASGPAGEGTLVSFPDDPQNHNEAKGLLADLKALGEATDGPALPAYAAVQLFAAAAAAKGAHSGPAIAESLKSGEAFATVLGPLRFDAKGDPQDLRFNWFSWNNGAYQTIAAETP